MKVLFVCLGNICRSTMAEGVFSHLAKDYIAAGRLYVESAGTANYHVGERADPRTLETLAYNGMELYSRARQVKKSDFYEYDYIFAMDKHNLSDLFYVQNGEGKAQIMLFREFDPIPENKEVPDPYYGDMSGFDRVFDIVFRTSESFLKHLQQQYLI
ncbi:MAG: low molecular weight phosphotyrosine protein phosphatase [Bacteroidetes bacterium]|nr:low molecular weight phosphotyrosine protein phosphatase [Bacteroidota bacterium]